MFLRIILLFLVILHVSAFAKVKYKKKVQSTEESTYEDSSDDDDDDDSEDDESDDGDYDSDVHDKSEYTSSDYDSDRKPKRTGKAVAGKGPYRYIVPNCTGDTSEERKFAFKAYKEHMKEQGFRSNYDERRVNMELHPENYEDEKEYSLTEEYVETTSTTTTEAPITVKKQRKPVRSRALTLPTGKLRRGRRLKRQAVSKLLLSFNCTLERYKVGEGKFAR